MCVRWLRFELAPGLFRAIATDSNVAVNSTQLYGSVTANSLTFSGMTALNAIGDEAILNIGSGGVLVLNASGTDFTGGLIQSGGNQLIVHQLDTGNTLDFNAQVLGSNGFIKTGAGAMSIDKQQFFTNSSQTTINNGLLTLNSGVDNTLTVIATNATPTLQSVRVNGGGTLDLFGRNQAIGTLDSTSTLPGTGGIVTNSSGTAALLTSADMGGNIGFAGAITGNLSLHPVRQQHDHADQRQHLHRCHHHPQRRAQPPGSRPALSAPPASPTTSAA